MQTNSCCSLFVARLLAEPYYVLVIEVPMFAPLPAQKGSSISVTSMKWASAGEDKHHAGPELRLRTRTRRGGRPLSRQSLTFWGQSVNKIKRGERPGPRGKRQRRAPPAPPGRGATVGASPCGHGPAARPRSPPHGPAPAPPPPGRCAPTAPRGHLGARRPHAAPPAFSRSGQRPGAAGGTRIPGPSSRSAGAASGYGTGLDLRRTEPTGSAARDGAPEGRVRTAGRAATSRPLRRHRGAQRVQTRGRLDSALFQRNAHFQAAAPPRRWGPRRPQQPRALPRSCGALGVRTPAARSRLGASRRSSGPGRAALPSRAAPVRAAPGARCSYCW